MHSLYPFAHSQRGPSPLVRTRLAPSLTFRLTLIGITALGLTASVPAHAQYLTLGSGDDLTVSGTGTVGTLGGLPVDNSTYYYSQPGFTDQDSVVRLNGTSTFTLANGGILAAAAGYQGLSDASSGDVTISGGDINTGDDGTALIAGGSGVLTISGGIFYTGTFGFDLDIIGNTGPVNISGGTFSAGENGVALSDTNLDPSTLIDGPVNVSGGKFSAGAGGFGIESLAVTTINLFSLNDTPFIVDGVSLNNTTLNDSLYESMPYGTNTISGTLANGDLLNTIFETNGTINLNPGITSAPVPESSTTVSFGLLLVLGLGGAVVAARKKKIAASA